MNREERLERFAQEYCKDLNGAASARRVGIDPRSAKTAACRMLKIPGVQARISQLLQKDYALDYAQVLGELAQVAFAPGSDESGAKVKLASKLRALELLGKYLGLFDGAPKTAPPVTIVEDIQES